MRSSQNALVHGACTHEAREEARKVNELLRTLRDLQNIARSLDEM